MLNKSTVISLLLSIFVLLMFTSCDDGLVSNDVAESDTFNTEYVESENSKNKGNGHTHTGGLEEGVYSEHLAKVNEQLAERGFTDIQLEKAETFTVNKNGEFQAGQTIFANDRTKRLDSQWVPGDERRGADGNNLTYLNYTPFMTANGTIDAEPSIDASFETWNNLKQNSGLDLVKVEDIDINPSAILGFEGVDRDPFIADIVTLGFLPGAIFEAVLGEGASEGVLGVAFTFNWLGTDEVALKEVWYNDNFAWSTDGAPGTVDIESVALHENGHALGFGHFGKLSVINSNGRLNVSPRAVMNASYLGPLRELLGTDEASFNNVFGNWPKD